MPASRMSDPCRFLCSLELAVPAKRTADGGKATPGRSQKVPAAFHESSESSGFLPISLVSHRAGPIHAASPAGRRPGSRATGMTQSDWHGAGRVAARGSIPARTGRRSHQPRADGQLPHQSLDCIPPRGWRHLPGPPPAAEPGRSGPCGSLQAPAHGPAAGRRFRPAERLHPRAAGTPCEQIRNDSGADIYILFSMNGVCRSRLARPRTIRASPRRGAPAGSRLCPQQWCSHLSTCSL